MSMNTVAMSSSQANPTSRAPLPMTVLMSLLPLFLVVDLFLWIAFLPNALRGHADFRQLYVAGYMVRNGYRHQLYNYDTQKLLQTTLVTKEDLALPFIRPAYQALLMVPLSVFSYRTAYLLFLAINVFLLGWCCRQVRAWAPTLIAKWGLLIPALVVAFLPINIALMQGQDSILLLALLMTSMAEGARGRDSSAGFLVGLGLFKLQLIIPIALLFIAWRRWRFVTALAVSTVSMSLVSLVVMGSAQAKAFVGSLMSVGGVSSADAIKFPLRVQLMANLRGVIASAFANTLSHEHIRLATILLSAILIFAVVSLVPRESKNPLPIAISAAVIVSYYLFIHDLSVLLIPILIAMKARIKASARSRDFHAWFAALAYIAPVCLIAMPNYFYSTCIAYFMLLIASLHGARSTSDQLAQDLPAVR